jgi:hypothetical protein
MGKKTRGREPSRTGQGQHHWVERESVGYPVEGESTSVDDFDTETLISHVAARRAGMKEARTTVKRAAEQGTKLFELKAARTNPGDGITFNAKTLGHREKRPPFTDAVRRLILTNPGR